MADTNGRYKVGQVGEKYELSGVDEELAEYWTRDEERYSLRELAAFFNRRVLESAMAAAGETPLDGEVDNVYRLLTDSNVSSGERTQTERRLERRGIDVEQVRADFVTYQAIRTYLNEALGVDHERDDEARIQNATESIKRLQNRLTSVTEDRIRRLQKTGELSGGEFRLLLDQRAFCEACSSQYEVTELLARGGCDCEHEESG